MADDVGSCSEAWAMCSPQGKPIVESVRTMKAEAKIEGVCWLLDQKKWTDNLTTEELDAEIARRGWAVQRVTVERA